MIDFILPDIGEGIVECELLEWLVAEGDMIAEDQAIAEVMTDKATVQIPAMHAGKVKKLYYQTGDIAKVHAPLFALEISAETNNANSANRQTNDHTEQAATDHQVAKLSRSQVDFILPDIGEGIVECELVKWLISEGDSVVEDQAVVEVMTDKALVEIPAKYSGTVSQLYYAQGDIAKVHTPLFAMLVNEAADDTPPPKAQSAISTDTHSQTKQQTLQTSGKALASPAVRRLARELGLDLSKVSGSGEKGRVLKVDLERGQIEPKELQSTTPAVTDKENTNRIRKEPIRGIQAAMAKQMKHAVSTVPHFTVCEEIEMDNLIAARQQLKVQFEKQGVKLSFMPFFIKALSLALKQFPIINSQVNQDCSEISYFDDHNIGLAVDSKIGLLVPNIKRVQDLSLFDIAKQSNELVEQARVGRVPSSALKGGTISISNIGVLGGTVATPVINAPESAIVALGKIQRLPRFDSEDNVVAVNIMQVSWSGDHRIIDGATMVRFNNCWKSYLENPLTMLVELR